MEYRYQHPSPYREKECANCKHKQRFGDDWTHCTVIDKRVSPRGYCEGWAKCQGLVFKAHVSQFRTAKGIGFSVRLVVSKRLSCPGCNGCAWQQEVLDDPRVLGIEQAVDGQLYRLVTVNERRDWETGVIADWDLSLVNYEEN